MEYFTIILTILAIAIVSRLVIKKHNTVFLFFAAGIIILLIANLINGNSVLGDKSTGFAIFDVFIFITNQFKSNISGVGTIILTVTGYSAYMKHINASQKLAFLATKPLKKVKNPYIVLSGVYLIGLLLKLVITSQAAIALLLLATTFPILIALGINKLTAASVICLVCLDWGPNDGSTIFAAEVAGMNVVDMFLQYQVYIVGAIATVLCIVIPFYYNYMNKKDQNKIGKLATDVDIKEDVLDANCPKFYATLPIIPLLIVFISSFTKVAIDVVSANFIGMAVVFVIEFIRRKDRKSIPNDMTVIFKAMADVFVSVVSIIISASIFAEGIKQLGGISILANMLVNVNGAEILMVLFLTLITYFAAVIMGSGAASWYAFGPLAPEIATKVGINQLALILPMELGAAIGRGMSPVAGASIAIAGYADLDVVTVVKRTAPLLILSLVVNIVVSIAMFVI